MSYPLYRLEAEERRQEKRSPEHFPLVYSKLDNRGNLVCMGNSETMDMTEGGCCIRLYHKLALADLIQMALWLPVEAPKEICGQVAWLKKEGYGFWLAGVKFLASIEEPFFLS